MKEVGRPRTAAAAAATDVPTTPPPPPPPHQSLGKTVTDTT